LYVRRVALLLAMATVSSCAPVAPRTSPTAAPTPTIEPTAGLEGAGSGGAGGGKPGTVVTSIDAVEQYFNPPTLTVPLGTSVQWRDLQGTHDVVAYDHTFASTVMFEGGTYSFTFTQAGHYPYVCTLHEGAGMVGEIVVESP